MRDLCPATPRPERCSRARSSTSKAPSDGRFHHRRGHLVAGPPCRSCGIVSASSHAVIVRLRHPGPARGRRHDNASIMRLAAIARLPLILGAALPVNLKGETYMGAVLGLRIRRMCCRNDLAHKHVTPGHCVPYPPRNSRRISGIISQRRRRADAGHAPIHQHHPRIGDGQGLVRVLLHHRHRGTGPAWMARDRPSNSASAANGDRPGGRLVQQQQPRVHHQRHRHCQHLPLPAGQGARGLAPLPGQHGEALPAAPSTRPGTARRGAARSRPSPGSPAPSESGRCWPPAARRRCRAAPAPAPAAPRSPPPPAGCCRTSAAAARLRPSAAWTSPPRSAR